MLSRLTRLSQRTREVMENIDRRRTAVGMPPIRSTGSSDELKPTQQEPRMKFSSEVRRKVRLEERLLVQSSPYSDLHGIRLPSIFERRQFVSRNSDIELVSR